MPASLSCPMSFVPVETAGWLPCWERASHSPLRVCCRKNVLVCIVYFFPPGVYVETLNLITSIPGPSFLTSYGVYISQLLRFARVCNHIADLNAQNKCLTARLLQQGYRYHKLRKTFSKFYRRHYELIFKFNVGLKTLLREGLSQPKFYGDLVYKFKKRIGRNDFSFHFRKIITRTDV